MTQNSSGSGSNTQSLNYTTINLQDAQGNHQNPILNAANGIVIGARLLPSMGASGSLGSSGGAPSPTITVDLKQQAAQLATQPGLSYLGELTKRHDVTWQKVQLASQSWNYSQSGLSQSGAIIIAIAVAAVTAGSSAELSATMVAGAGLTGATATAAGAALAAGMTSLASQTAVALANNQGDIGKTLQAMGSNSAIRNTVTAMVTAGALAGLSDMFSASSNTTPGTSSATDATFTGQSGAGSLTNSTSGIATSQALNDFAGNLAKNVTNNLTGTVINTAINGKPLNEAAIAGALTSALITAGTAQAANSIGDATQSGALNTYTQAIAHAVAGCAGGAAAAGNSGCGAGAVGAVVGELTAQYASSSGMTDKTDITNLARLMSATAGLLVSNGDTSAVNVAASMGANAAANNLAAHLGLAVSITIPGTPLTLSGGAGVVVDDKGNFGWYKNLPATINQSSSIPVPGFSTGGSGSLGLSIGAYPAATSIYDYAGPFNNLSVGTGAGAYGSIDVFQDPSKGPLNPSGYGGGLTLGVGVGGGGSISRTNTTVCSTQAGQVICK